MSLCLCLFSANILAFELRARNPGVGRKERGGDRDGGFEDTENGIKKRTGGTKIYFFMF